LVASNAPKIRNGFGEKAQKEKAHEVKYQTKKKRTLASQSLPCLGDTKDKIIYKLDYDKRIPEA